MLTQHFTSSVMLFAVLFSTLLAALPSGDTQPASYAGPNPDLFGIVGLDPYYTTNEQGEVNQALLEQMMSDMARLGARWVRIEFHAEYDQPEGPGPIDYSKHDWFINELAPKYGIKVLAVIGSGVIGDNDPSWSFDHINEPLNDQHTNRYIDEYLRRVREITSRYGPKLAAIEILNEPNASEILSLATDGRNKAVYPSNYGALLRGSYEIVQETSPSTEVVLGGTLYDTEYETLPEGKERSYDLDWLEGVYGSRAVMSYYAETGKHPFDAVAAHPYFLTPPEIIDYLNQLRKMQARFHDASPVWITEIGTPATPPTTWTVFGLQAPSQEEQRQAEFLSAVYTTVSQRAPFVEHIFWFKYEDFPINGELNGWGLVRLGTTASAYGTTADTWPRKLAYGVYQALAHPRQTPLAPVSKPIRMGPDTQYFDATGHTLRGEFLAFWKAHGGPEIFGAPITEPFMQGGRTVQYFEKVRFEHHPDHDGDPFEIQLSQLGRYFLGDRTFPALPAGQGNGRYFPETGQYVQGGFLQFWEDRGGLDIFGLPLSPEIQEGDMIVQYFERARFEWEPQQGGGGEVKLSQLGRMVTNQPGWYR